MIEALEPLTSGDGSASYRRLLGTAEWREFAWRKKEQAGWACQWCGERARRKRGLEVHHPFYRPGAKPWEYDFGEVICVCEKCHQRWETGLRAFRELVGPKLGPEDWPNLISLLLDNARQRGGLSRALAWLQRETI